MVLCLIIFGVAILALFMVWEAKFAKSPVIPFRIFQSSTNLASFAVSCLHSFAFISYDFFLPLYFQVVLGFKPIMSGVTLFALILPMSAVTMIGGLVVRKTGNYVILITGGTLVMTLGTGLFISFGPNLEWGKIIPFQILTGVGAGLLFQTPMISLQTHTRQRDVAAAMSAFSFLRSLFTSVSIVAGTVLIQRGITGGKLTAGHGGESETPNKAEYVSALRNMWIFYTCIGALMFLSSFFIKGKPKKKVESLETSTSDLVD